MENIGRTQKRRIEYFDTTKGLLMLFLIWGHLIVFQYSLEYGLESLRISQIIQNSVPFYRAFFMQTFFIITGFCTSWNRTFEDFLITNLKTIILPAFIFLPFNYVAISITTPDSEFSQLLIHYIINGIPWFLASLFIAKMLFYPIIRFIKNREAICILLSLLFILGLYLNESTSLKNVWNYKHALVMIPFLGVGYFARIIKSFDFKHLKGDILADKNLSILSIPYFGLIILWQVLGLGLGLPAVDSFIDIHYITCVFHIIFAISGSALILLICKKLKHISILNLIGRQSLFVYLTHAFIAVSLMKLWELIFGLPTSMIGAVIFYSSIFTLTLFLLIIGCRIMETKYLKWTVGQFSTMTNFRKFYIHQ